MACIKVLLASQYLGACYVGYNAGYKSGYVIPNLRVNFIYRYRGNYRLLLLKEYTYKRWHLRHKCFPLQNTRKNRSSECFILSTAVFETSLAAMSHDGKPSKELEAAHIESFQVEKSKLEDSELIVVSPEEAKKILWKIDRRLLSVVGLVYCISLLDRGNFALARSAGWVFWSNCMRLYLWSQSMDKDLQLSVGNRYVWLIYLVQN